MYQEDSETKEEDETSAFQQLSEAVDPGAPRKQPNHSPIISKAEKE
jgi:hypothetical protein